MEPQIQYARRPDGARTAYATMGDGPVLVLPPGGTTHLEWYYGCTEAHELFCKRLAEVRTLVLYDRHGCGLSDRNRTDFTPEDDMLDIETVIEAVGASQVDLFGISWGGFPTLAYAARHPERVRRMILYGTAADGPRVPPELVEARAAVAVLRRTNPEQYLRTEAIKFFPSGTDPETFQSLVRMLRDSATLEMVENLEKVRFDNQSVLKQIMTPALVIHRRGDQVAQFVFGQYMARHLPNSRLIPLNGDAHYPWVDDVDSVLRPTIEFLTEADETDGERGGAGRAQAVTASATIVSKPPEAKTFANGRYVVVRLLGQGTQKSVYLVEDTVLERQCALSMVNPALLDQSDIDRIEREAKTMAQFGTHPNIVTVYDYGEEDDAPFIVCEYVPGGELREELAEAAGPLPLERALAVAKDICRALSFAHGEDVVHRDLKPENVWLTKDGSAKLGDFGIALTMGRTRLTMPGGLTGTATYMAPEQVSGGDVDARSDLYAFGVLMYELVTGRPPFVGDDPNAIMYQHVNGEPESPTEHNEAVPADLERLIMRLLAKTKAERPASAEEVLAELENVATELSEGQPGAKAAVGGAEAKLIEPRIQYAKTEDGVNIAYAAEGEGPPLVWLVIPLAAHVQRVWAMFPNIGPPLAGTFRLIPYDPRGAGLSDRDAVDYSMKAMMRDLDAVADRTGLQSFAVLALQGTVPIAVAYAATFPDRVSHLILIDGWTNPSDLAGMPAWKAQEALIDGDWTLFTETVARVLAGMDDPHVIKNFGEYIRGCIEPETWRAYFVAIQKYDVADLLPDVRAQTLVLHNNDNPWSPIRAGQKLAAGIPDARLLTIDDMNYQRVAALIEDFAGPASTPTAAPSAVGGFATILFTDMEASTTLADQLGDAKAQEVRRAHNEIVRAALAANDGNEIKHTGDGIMASFSTASSALECAITIQRGVAAHKEANPESPLAVYVGLNAGEPIAEDDDLFGTSINLAARICDHAEAGQILAANVVRELAAGKQFLFSDLGETELRGFEDPVKLWELRWRDDQ